MISTLNACRANLLALLVKAQQHPALLATGRAAQRGCSRINATSIVLMAQRRMLKRIDALVAWQAATYAIPKTKPSVCSVPIRCLCMMVDASLPAPSDSANLMTELLVSKDS